MGTEPGIRKPMARWSGRIQLTMSKSSYMIIWCPWSGSLPVCLSLPGPSSTLGAVFQKAPSFSQFSRTPRACIVILLLRLATNTAQQILFFCPDISRGPLLGPQSGSSQSSSLPRALYLQWCHHPVWHGFAAFSIKDIYQVLHSFLLDKKHKIQWLVF